MMKPKVLIFIDWFTPGYKAGGPTTSNVNIVNHLSDDFDFWIITSDTDYHAKTPYSDIVPNCWIDRGNCHVWYFSRSKLSLSAIAKVAEDVNASVWYINGIYSRFFSIYPLVIAWIKNTPKTIVSARGMLSPHSFAIKGRLKRTFLGIEKTLGVYKRVLFHGTNEIECEHIRAAISSKAACISIENLPRKLELSFSVSGKSSGKIRLVSFARISSEKNTLYAIKALRNCRTSIEYDIYGQINSTEYWEQCLSEIKELPSNVKVDYRGSIAPTHLSNLFQNYDAMYLPTTGENFGHAILESFMHSRPVVISDRTPWKNLEQKGVGYDIELSMIDRFGDVIDLMADMSNEEYNDMCKRAYDFSRITCNSSATKEKYNGLFLAE